ncbi:MAG: hypothetical protein ACR2HG_05090 [Pyrinomonadaceae bacterium]
MEYSSPFIPLLLIMLLAVVVAFLVSRVKFVRIPIVVWRRSVSTSRRLSPAPMSRKLSASCRN